jgi:hypothetical protein
MRLVPSFCDFNSNVSDPMPIHHTHSASPPKESGGGGAAIAAAAPRRATPPTVDVDAARVDLSESESAAAKMTAGGVPRSPAMVFAESLYENMRQT